MKVRCIFTMISAHSVAKTASLLTETNSIISARTRQAQQQHSLCLCLCTFCMFQGYKIITARVTGTTCTKR